MKHTDEELTAYLDGETSATNAASIAADPDAKPRLAALELDKKALQMAFSSALGVAETRNLQHRLQCAQATQAANQPARPSVALKVASYILAIGIGVAIAGALKPTPSDWRIEVAHYQALYVPDTLTPVSLSPAGLQAQFNRASDVLGVTLNPEDFANINGLKLRRAQVLGFNGAPLVQIAFTKTDGTPVAFCIVAKAGTPTPIDSDMLMGLASAYWSTETLGFLAIGGTNISDAQDWAGQIQSQI